MYHIYPQCQSFVSLTVLMKRRVEWGCKVLGSFIGTDDCVLRQLNNKMSKIHKLTDSCGVVETIVSQILASGHCRIHQLALEAAVTQCITNLIASGTAGAAFTWMVFSKKKKKIITIILLVEEKLKNQDVNLNAVVNLDLDVLVNPDVDVVKYQ